MAIDAYVVFKKYDGTYLDCESTVSFENSGSDQLNADKMFSQQPGTVFEVDEWSQLSIENKLTIGSQTTGTGGGRVEFKEFSVTKRVDKSSSRFFGMACAGTPFENVAFALRRSSGGDVSGLFFVRFDFKLVAVKTITWSHDDEGPKEELTFEYGGLYMQYCQQQTDGQQMAPRHDGWDRTKNIRSDSQFTIKYSS